MTKTFMKRSLSYFLCVMLIAAMALSVLGCNDTGNKTENDPTKETPVEAVSIGEGSTSFIFEVKDTSGEVKRFKVSTDKTIVGDALSEVGLIEGEQGTYGLYVKTVNGLTLDYDKDGKYWAFYVNDAYATKGVDQTDIVPEDIYSFRAE